jgi:plastocyanin
MGRNSSIAVLWGLTFFAGQALAQTMEVGIKDYKFEPAELKIKAGTTVKWVNNEKRTTHSVLFTGPGGFESERFFPGESWQRAFDKPGVYPYSCGPHPEMKGMIEVGE